MKKLVLFLLVFILFLSSCSSSAPAGDSATSTPQTTPAPSTQAPETTVPVQHINEKGPFDDNHYEIGLRALQSIDSYLDGDLTLSGVNKALTTCYDEIKNLPALPETDPFYAGNDFVYSYVFLAYCDFSFQLSDFETKKFEDRNYLAAALGEPTKEYNLSSTKTSDIEDVLVDFESSMKEKFPDSDFSHFWYEGDLFIDLMLPQFDYYLNNKATLSAESRATALEVSHGYVSGDFAQSIYSFVREVGGSDFRVFITLSCPSGICCVSCDLVIFQDPLNE